MRQRRSAFYRALCGHHIPINFVQSALRYACLHDLEASADACQEIVEIVGKPAGQLTNCFHLLRLAKLLLDRSLVLR